MDNHTFMHWGVHPQRQLPTSFAIIAGAGLYTLPSPLIPFPSPTLLDISADFVKAAIAKIPQTGDSQQTLISPSSRS